MLTTRSRGVRCAIGERTRRVSQEMNLPIYLDNHATTPTDPRVAEVALHHMLEAFGNASSVDHVLGDAARGATEAAAEHVAKLVRGRDANIVFTSGATEAINLVIQGLARISRDQSSPIRIVVSAVEHHAVLRTCEALSNQGLAYVRVVEVDRFAQIDIQELSDHCRNGVDVVCVMAANNEVGTIYPIAECAAVAHEHGALFFTDATQVAGSGPIRFTEWALDALVLSGHKMYGPKGIGALVLARGIKLAPIIYGGQQNSSRPGTVNVPGAVALGEASRLRLIEGDEDARRIQKQRDKLQFLLSDALPTLSVNGDQSNRLPGNLHISIPGIPNQAVIARVRHRLAVSTGTACSSGIESPSHVLRAMCMDDSDLLGSIRIGVGKFNTEDEITSAAGILIDAVREVAQLI